MDEEMREEGSVICEAEELGQENIQIRLKDRFAELGKDTVVYGFMAGVSSVTGLILLPLFTRVFSTDQYGVIDIVATLTSILSIFARLSLPSAITRYFYEKKEALDRNSFISTLLAFVLVVSAGLVIVGGMFSNTIASLFLRNKEFGLFVFLGFVSAAFSALSSLPQMVLRMERRIVRFNLLNILYSVFYVGLALYLVFAQSQGLTGVFAASVLASLLQLLLAIAWTRQYLTRYLSFPDLKHSLKYSLPIIPAVMVTWINRHTDRLVLLAFLGLSGVGIFGAAARIGAVFNFLTTVFRQGWIPYRMFLIKAPEEERNRFYRLVLRYYACGFSSLALIFTAISPEILRILVPAEYHKAYVVIPWIVGATILHASGPITTMGILISERTYAASIAAWGGAVLNVLLAVVLIPALGIRGAAIGTFVAELVFTSMLWYFTARYTNIRFDRKPMIIILICYVFTANVLLWLTENIEPSLISLTCRMVVVGIAILLIACQIMDRTAFSSIRSFVFRILHLRY
jgi:O-antigen/teichoic acid export membrane protein